MAASLLTQGVTAIRDNLKTLVTHVGVATDQTSFSVSQTALDPANAGASERLIKTSSEANVDASTFDASMSIDGDSEFTNQTIWTVGVLDGSARTDALSRTVRTQGIGVQAGDSFTIGVRVVVSDAG